MIMSHVRRNDYFVVCDQQRWRSDCTEGVHLCSLICDFVFHSLECTQSQFAICENSIFLVGYVAEYVILTLSYRKPLRQGFPRRAPVMCDGGVSWSCSLLSSIRHTCCISEQRKLRRVNAYAQSRQSICFSHTRSGQMDAWVFKRGLGALAISTKNIMCWPNWISFCGTD